LAGGCLSFGDVGHSRGEAANEIVGRKPGCNTWMRGDLFHQLTDERIGFSERREHNRRGIAAERPSRRLRGRRAFGRGRGSRGSVTEDNVGRNGRRTDQQGNKDPHSGRTPWRRRFVRSLLEFVVEYIRHYLSMSAYASRNSENPAGA
jgi:hypothetical protein